MKLIHYYYDETVDTVPPETLTVYSPERQLYGPPGAGHPSEE